MAEHSTIEWTDATWNPITGCSMVSAGCTNCYAMGLAGTRLRNHPSRAGLTRVTGGRHVWTGEVRFNEEWLDQPLRWRRPRRIFVCAHGDLFHEEVPDEWIDRVFAVMALAPHHTFQVLTKRPARMRAYLDKASGRVGDRVMQLRRTDVAKRAGMGPSCIGPVPYGTPGSQWWPLPHVWIGTSSEDQATADARIPDLLAAPAAIRFLSAEPLLGPVDLTRWSGIEGDGGTLGFGLDLVIVGGESGPGARPMHPAWARSLRDQCVAAGVAFHFKQWGEWGPGSVLMTTGEPVFRAFKDYQNWVHKAPTWVNGGMCIDAAGRHCKIGADFMRARDEGTFPVTIIHRVGKKAAGRRLDGRTWDQMPGGAV